MIRTIENSNVQVIELGKGTTFISQVHVDKDNVSSGISFSNHADGKIHGDEIIIEITDTKGILSYIRPIIQLIQTWNIDTDGLHEQLTELENELNQYLKFDNK